MTSSLRDNGDSAQGSTLVKLGEWGGRTLQAWRLILALGAAGAATAVVVVLLMTPVYTTSVTLLPEATMTQPTSSLAELASRFTGTPIGDAAQRPQLFALILQSRTLLERVIKTPFIVPGTSDSASLLEIYGVKTKNTDAREHAAVAMLKRRIGTSVDNRTGLVTLSVSASNPQLARDVANRFTELLADFNVRSRQTQARSRRQFSEGRVENARVRLAAAENALRQFYDRNRTWQTAPTLQFEEARLRRDATLQQELYYAMQRELESARIAEVNDTPTFTIVDSAVAPIRPDRPKRRVAVISGGLLGILVGIGLAWAAAYFRDVRKSRPEDFDRLGATWESVRSSFRKKVPM